MHKVFGIKDESLNYTDRHGAYLIPFRKNRVGVVKLPHGLFLVGGGIENNETDQETIERESIEETGYTVTVGTCIGSAEAWAINSKIGPFHPCQKYYLGSLDKYTVKPIELDHELVWMLVEDAFGKMYSDMQNWALEEAWKITCAR